MNCRNHSDRSATHVASMPSAVKRLGEYREYVPLCEPCASNVAAIGYAARLLEKDGDQ